MFRLIRRRLALALSVGSLALSLVFPGHAAAVVLFTFDVEMGQGCASGTGPASTQLTIKLKSSSGTLQGKAIVTTDGTGDWFTCDFWWEVDPGDTISANDGSNSRTFTIPSVSFKANRVSDVVSGLAPANSSVNIQVLDCQDFSCSSAATSTRSTSASGAFSKDFTAMYNLRGNDRVIVTWTSPNGDTVQADHEVANLYVTLGSPDVSGIANPGGQPTIELRAANGNLRGSFTDGAGHYYGNFSGVMRNGAGLSVDALAGNKVIGSFATDATVNVMDPGLTGNPGTDVISGTCYPNRPFYVEADDPTYSRSPDWSSYVGVAGANGNFSVDIATLGHNAGFDLMSGDLLYVECRTSKGDILVAFAEVP